MKKCLFLLCFLTLSSYGGVQVCFTPGQPCENLFVAEIDKASYTLDVQEYHLTSEPIIDAILRARGRGVKVIVILDKTAIKEALPFVREGISTYIDYKVRIAHNKVVIVDDETIIGGSYNPTASAQKRNAENLLIIDDKDLAYKYSDNFIGRMIHSRMVANN